MYKGKFEDNKRGSHDHIRNRRSKDRQCMYKDQQKRDEKTIIYNTLHRKLKTEKHEPHKNIQFLFY